MEANLSIFKYPEAHSNGRNFPGFSFGSPIIGNLRRFFGRFACIPVDGQTDLKYS